jgi:hypothetical protein
MRQVFYHWAAAAASCFCTNFQKKKEKNTVFVKFGQKFPFSYLSFSPLSFLLPAAAAGFEPSTLRGRGKYCTPVLLLLQAVFI